MEELNSFQCIDFIEKNIRICFRGIGTGEEKDGNYRLLYITSVEFSTAMPMWLIAPPNTEDWPNSPQESMVQFCLAMTHSQGQLVEL